MGFGPCRIPVRPTSGFGLIRQFTFIYKLIDYFKVEFNYSCVTAFLLHKLLNER